MSLIRNDSVYVSWRTRRRLKWLARGQKSDDVRVHLTADEIADQLLNKIIEQEHPELVQLEKNLDDREAEVVERLSAP